MDYNKMQIAAIKLDGEWASTVTASIISSKPKLQEDIILPDETVIESPVDDAWWKTSDEYEEINPGVWVRKDRNKSGPNYVNQWEQLGEGILFILENTVPIFRLAGKYNKLRRVIKTLL